jgi:hypothetical protein
MFSAVTHACRARSHLGVWTRERLQCPEQPFIVCGVPARQTGVRISARQKHDLRMPCWTLEAARRRASWGGDGNTHEIGTKEQVEVPRLFSKQCGNVCLIVPQQLTSSRSAAAACDGAGVARHVRLEAV